MKQSSLSILAFGIYLLSLAIVFTFLPNAFITLFGFEATTEVWIRILGYILGVLAFYFIMAVAKNCSAFYSWSVYARLMTLPVFLVFVIQKMAPSSLLLFGAIDAITAIWTGLMLIQESSQKKRDIRARET